LGTCDTSPSNDPFPARNIVAEDTLSQNAKEKATKIYLELKSITQLYNEYAVPFEMWEEMLIVALCGRHGLDYLIKLSLEAA